LKLNYELELPQSYRIHPVFHATLLSTYHENDIHGPNEIEATPDLIEKQEEYEVAGIIKHRERDNQIQYLVSWKNMSHDENEWLTEPELAPHALEILNNYRKAM
jgi:hypothetical protein